MVPRRVDLTRGGLILVKEAEPEAAPLAVLFFERRSRVERTPANDTKVDGDNQLAPPRYLSRKGYGKNKAKNRAPWFLGALTYCYCSLYDGVTFKRCCSQSRRAAGLRYAPDVNVNITQKAGWVKRKWGRGVWGYLMAEGRGFNSAAVLTLRQAEASSGGGEGRRFVNISGVAIGNVRCY